MESMIIEIKNRSNWSNIMIKNCENEFLSAYVFHNRIVETNYSNDIIATIVEDKKDHDHGLNTAFVYYFNELKMQVGSVFVCDRNKTQISANKTVFFIIIYIIFLQS